MTTTMTTTPMTPVKPNPAITALRWLAFLPAAFVGGFLGTVVAHWTAWFFWSIEPSRAEVFFRTIFEGAAFGAVFVFVGVKTAPKFSKPLAIMLGALGALISGAFGLTALEGQHWLVAVSFISGAATAIFMSVVAVRENGFH
jgi:hypothetical protein